MDPIKSFKTKVSNVQIDEFDQLALDLFQYQATNNPVYCRFVQLLKVDPIRISSIRDIPFLPIQFFKNQDIKSGRWVEQRFFLSSGTTGIQRSKHMIEDEKFYLRNCLKGFEQVFGPISELTILSLLPNYENQSHSSLIFMMDYLMKKSQPNSGFISTDFDFKSIPKTSEKVVLFGVSFALMDLVGRNLDLKDYVIIETGGMKGRGLELTKDEFYTNLRRGLNVRKIHSEYGMTELLSQAYSDNGVFKPSATMKVFIRDANDPRKIVAPGKTGGINVIDLANIHSCAFIETQDLGQLQNDNSFEVLGRFDNSDIRGCSLMSI